MPDKERILHIPESIEKQGISGQSKEIANNDKSTFRMPRQNPYFCLKRLKIKAFEEREWNLYPHCTPILCELCDSLKAKFSDCNLSTGLPSINMNTIYGERSSFGDFFRLRKNVGLNVGLY